jgi:hypothetical protein
MAEDTRSVFQKIGDAVVDFAPGIAGILAATGVGAPIAAGVGAVAALGRAFGLGSSAKPEEVLGAISADPEIRLKALVAENDFKAEMGRQEIEKLKTANETLKLELDDIKDARKRDSETKDHVNRNLAYGIIAAFVVMIAAVLLGWSKADSAVIGTLIGYLSAKAEQIISYYFGSSRGSQAKTDIIARSQPIK